MFVKKALVFLVTLFGMVLMHMFGNGMVNNTLNGMYDLGEFNTVSIIVFILWYLIAIFLGLWFSSISDDE